jgi:alkylation response protein AidB-like acyl-CoA dehydrogenase
MAGAGQKILEVTVDYAKTRVQFDEPIGVNQYVQGHCVKIFAMVEACSWVTYQAAWAATAGLAGDIEAAVAKAWTGDAMEYVCWHAHQVLGGVGYTADHGLLPLFTRRCKAAQLYLGDSRHHRGKIAQQFDHWVLKLPSGKPLGLWEEVEPRAQ